MLSLLFKEINLLFAMHTIKSVNGKFPTIMLAYMFSSLIILNIC